jgi:predicted ABC-type ATPase
MILRARGMGYRISLIFVALSSAELHVLRVAQRVQLGGHFIPEETIRRRYDTSFANLGEVASACDVLRVYDNSSRDGYRLAIELVDGAVRENGLSRASGFDRRIAAVLAPALSLEAETLFVD